MESETDHIDVPESEIPKMPTYHDEERLLEAFRKAYAGAKDGDRLVVQFGRSGRFSLEFRQASES